MNEQENHQKNTGITVCPCGSGKSYAECCEPVILNKEPAKTAEALMRARYSAYVTHKVDFIIKSCEDTEKSSIDPGATRAWSEGSTWRGLKILHTEKGGQADTEGIVEFEAQYTSKAGLRQSHHETANFKKTNGQWLYVNGALQTATVTREGRKVGRNEPCPCGSGKKYKQCCGK
jgi:SEC-C motif-containing protein